MNFSSFLMESRKTYSDEEKQKIWEKATIAKDKKTGKELHGYRFDNYNALMIFSEYGNRDSEFGWEIDHIDKDPKNNDNSNLRPLFWRNNCARNAENPVYYHYDSKSEKNEC